MTFAVVRVRGICQVRRDIADTMAMLRLEHSNHCVLIPETPEYKGMLQKSKDYITWGEVTIETVEALLKSRLRLAGNKPVTDEFLKKNTPYPSIKALAQAVMDGKTTLAKVEGVLPVLRLSPPRKGWDDSVKRHYAVGGALGYRGKDMNELLTRMM